MSAASFLAIADLGNLAEIPVFLCIYSDSFETFRVTALNDRAKQWCGDDGIVLGEYEWVHLLYDVRGYGDMSLDVKRYFQRKR